MQVVVKRRGLIFYVFYENFIVINEMSKSDPPRASWGTPVLQDIIHTQAAVLLSQNNNESIEATGDNQWSL